MNTVGLYVAEIVDLIIINISVNIYDPIACADRRKEFCYKSFYIERFPVIYKGDFGFKFSVVGYFRHPSSFIISANSTEGAYYKI